MTSRAGAWKGVPAPLHQFVGKARRVGDSRAGDDPVDRREALQGPRAAGPWDGAQSCGLASAVLEDAAVVVRRGRQRRGRLPVSRAGSLDNLLRRSGSWREADGDGLIGFSCTCNHLQNEKNDVSLSIVIDRCLHAAHAVQLARSDEALHRA